MTALTIAYLPKIQLAIVNDTSTRVTGQVHAKVQLCVIEPVVAGGQPYINRVQGISGMRSW